VVLALTIVPRIGGVVKDCFKAGLIYQTTEVADVPFNKYRILLEVDPGVKTGGDLLKRGQHYAERKMWAKAAIHFRQAAYKLYENLEAHLSLAVAYINLKLYDQAEKSLARARELSSGSFRVEKLQALLGSRKEKETPSSS
jgi:tetratricopeptide (TPR) repeat protein